MDNTFQDGFAQQYRVLKYIKDILNNWFADPANILDQRIKNQLFHKGKLKKGCLKIGTAFNSARQFIGATPSISISLGDVSYQRVGINFSGNPQFIDNPTKAPLANVRYKNVPINITIVTQTYDATVLLAQLIQMFLTTNIDIIQEDCTMLDAASVIGISAPVMVRPAQAANAKQLCKSTIQLLARGHVCWATDTQGPVFQGLSYITNL